MPVIKHQQAAPLLKEAIVLDLGDIGRQAARVVAAAQEKAKRIVNEAQARADKLVEGAHERGHEQGYAQGLEQGIADGTAQGLQQGHDEAHAQVSARLAELQKNWTAGLHAWEQKQDEFARESRDAALALAIRLTEKIIHRVVEVDPSAVVDQVGAALAHVMESAKVNIRICPKDRELVEESLPKLLAEFSHLTAASIVQDASIAPGGCIVTCGRGSIDGTLETQLARVVDLIFPQNTNDSSEVAASDAGIETDNEAAVKAAMEASAQDEASLDSAVDQAIADAAKMAASSKPLQNDDGPPDDESASDAGDISGDETGDASDQTSGDQPDGRME